MADFILADIYKIMQLETDSADAVQEFDRIKSQFNSINSTLLEKWKGDGADAYKYEVDHILENIGGIKDVLDALNTGVFKDIKDAYNKLDAELDIFNRNPSPEE